MQAIRESPHTRYDPQIDKWILLQDFESNGITVPAGFAFDGSSIPRPFRIWIDRASLGIRAPLIHDWRYFLETNAGRAIAQFGIEYVRPAFNILGNRKDTDLLFLEHMKEDGVGAFRRRAAYFAVRVGGRKAWET